MRIRSYILTSVLSVKANDNLGVRSGYSNSLEVPKPRDTFYDPVGFPFRNFRFPDSCYASYLGQSKANEICEEIG